MRWTLALLIGCAGSQRPDPETPVPEPEPAEVKPEARPGVVVRKPSASRAAPSREYGPNATGFAVRWHDALDEGNLATSGVSAQLAFSMLAAGAKGKTLEEFGTLFGTPVTDAWHIDNARAMAAFNDTAGVELQVVNGVWANKGFGFKEGFTKALSDNYLVTPATLDFSDAQGAADHINRWTKQSTGGMIDKLFEPADVAGASFVLANAVSFKGKWATPFDEDDTAPLPFATPSGSKDVPTMRGKVERVSYVEADDYRAIALPYAENRSAMVIILPNDGVKLEDVEGSLDMETMGRMAFSGRRDVNVRLPRWKSESTHDLKGPLADLGLQSALSGGDFSGISDQGLAIDKAIQKVFVEVTEEGTKAAAATGVVMKTTAMPAPAADFFVDRPFFWALWHMETNTPLFTGRVVDPS